MAKRPGTKKVISITLEPEDVKRLDTLSAKMGVSKSAVIREFLRQAVDAEPASFVLAGKAKAESAQN